MTDNLTEQDRADLDKLYETGEVPSFHPVLEVWREVLKPAAAEADKKVTPQWASRITSSYREVNFADMDYVRDSYFAKIGELARILELEIATDDDALSYATPEEDAAENAFHYKNLLLQWQLAVLSWEMDWSCNHEHAGAELAAISEVHKMFFGDQGLTAFLENIRFEFTDDDQQQLADALTAFRGEG
jgi:hypothetical protein